MSVINLLFELVEEEPLQVREADGPAGPKALCHRVRLTVDEGQTVEGRFGCELSNRKFREPVELVHENNCDRDVLGNIGVRLWSGLVSSPEISQLFEQQIARGEQEKAVFHFRLTFPNADLEQLPWEALFNSNRSWFLGSRRRYCIIRHPPGKVLPPRPSPPSQKCLRILMVIPEGSELKVGIEYNNLAQTVTSMGDRALLKRLDGTVTVDRLQAELREESWDIIHYLGHGRLDDKGRPEIRLNQGETKGDDFFLDAERFASLFADSRVRLAFLNCCWAAKSANSNTLSGMGPYLMNEGIPAILAMRYQIGDDQAIDFANTFYRELLEGSRPGRVDLAVQAARRQIYLKSTEGTARDFITPILFLGRGCEHLFELEAPAPTLPKTRLASQPRVGAVSEHLQRAKKALEQHRCIPVVGTGIHTALAQRNGAPSYGPLELAKRLADQGGFPTRDQDFGLRERAGEWMDFLLLQWVCQHFERNRERYELVEAVDHFYQDCRPPLLLQKIAQWNVPGLIYTHFDGLMKLALEQAHNPALVINRIDQQIDVPQDHRLLINLRGSLSNHESLILTEVDHDQLWGRIEQISSHVLDLVNGHLGRSLLFLGVCPRDPLIRFLSNLLFSEATPNRGPFFFACQHPTAVDEAYWTRYHAKWIPEDVHTIIDYLSASTD